MTQDTNPNLQVIGRALISFAATLKTISNVAMGLGAIPLLWGITKLISDRYEQMAGLGLILAGLGLLSIGLAILVASTFMGAMGEVLLSLVSIEANISQVNQTMQLVAGVPPSATLAPMPKHCQQCGSTLENRALFCEHCGQIIG